MPEQNMFKRGETWWLRVVIDGKEHRESLQTSNVRSARSRRDKRLAEISESKWEGPRHTWAEAVTAYLVHAKDQIAPNTLRRYAVSFAQIEPWLRDHAIDAIDGAVTMKLIAERRKVASVATVRRDLTAVSRVLEFAEAHGWREGVNPTLTKRKLYKERRDPIVLPEPKDIEAVIARCSARHGALMRAAWLTGCRQNELVTTQWRFFDAEAGTLEVIGKGSKRRTLRLSEAAKAHIRAQPRTLIGASGKVSPLIFCHEDGGEIGEPASYFARVSERVAASARKDDNPFRRFRFHDLRHLYAVDELRRGRGIYDLQKHLGHTSVTVTEMYLEFLTPGEAEEAKARAG